MTTTAVADEVSATRLHRFRLNRAGILNVWQYDDQQFDFADGRLLLRGANGAGKSKTLEMLLPFVIDGDKARMTASAQHHTSLLWLMTDGYEGQARVGYLWVEFARNTPDGTQELLTCGVGIRASASARAATAWFFTTDRKVGDDLLLEDDAGPLSRPRLAESLGEGGHVFDQSRAYKEHVGRVLFGLGVERYDEVLRLLYWLRQPQVGEDIEPTRLAEQLLQALPQLDDQTVRAAGDTFDELAAFGEQIDRRDAAARALAELGATYVSYAQTVATHRAGLVLSAHREQSRRRSDLRREEEHLAELVRERQTLEGTVAQTDETLRHNRGRLRQLQDSPEARSQQRLTDLATGVRELDRAAAMAEKALDRSEGALRKREERQADDRKQILGLVEGHADAVRKLEREIRSLFGAPLLASSLTEVSPSLDDAEHADRLDQVLAAFSGDVETAKQAVGRRQAALLVVREALKTLAAAQQKSKSQEDRAADAEARWESAAAQAAEAQSAAERIVDELWAGLREWVADSVEGPFTLPDELTVRILENLEADAREALEPALRELRDAQQAAGFARQQAADTVVDLAHRREEIERETDPAPPRPVIDRTPRPDGAPLWRLVDFAPDLSAPDRAGLEAALQSSGLLDAWVRPSGAVLDPEHLDTLLPLGPAEPGDSLLDALVVDLPPDSDVSADVVEGVLRRVRLGPTPENEERESAARVAADGSWTLGVLTGRARKPKAQYVGATARADERRRRLDEVIAAIAEAQRVHDEAADQAADLSARIEAIGRWLRSMPSVQPLLRAWATVDERLEVAARDQARHVAAQESAQIARRQVSRCRDEVERMAREHETPAEPDALAALEERLRSMMRDLLDLQAPISGLRRELSHWGAEHQSVLVEAGHVQEGRNDAERARERARQSAAELAELEAAVGADVATLRRRLDELESAISLAQDEVGQLTERLRDLDRAAGRAQAAVESAQQRVAEQEEALRESARDLGALVVVPGLLNAVFDKRELPDTAALNVAASLQPGDPLPSGLVTVARSLAGSEQGNTTEAFNEVFTAYNNAQTGPAADHEPRVVVIDDLLAVVGRDDGGEHSIVELAARVGAAVEKDRILLTQRERDQFEQHILGELGDAIRRRRLEAEELVAAMNRLLGGVSTSQGIRVKLDWRLRDDVPGEAREAMRLLAQPIGALLPEERASLRDSLHRLIEVSRAEQPELSYAEHLGQALDYRRWFAFRIRYTRPEVEGRWLDLHRRSPLSQGEQKVLCYLPLFAAAAAHFTSLAGAAPHAPRLVLLDDAFPKIDVRTHPLLFGLLVQLDLDFVITSERLWGDHESLPSLAIYEALRDPTQRGIAQYEFRWDGRVLRAMN